LTKGDKLFISIIVISKEIAIKLFFV